MKKQHPTSPKLAFSKEKVASLSPASLDHIQGGQASIIKLPTSQSSYGDFTCGWCTTIVPDTTN